MVNCAADNLQTRAMTNDAKNDRTAGGHLESNRLATAAVNMVTERYNPDQIILFGSAARGEMTDDSDIDLLVIKNHRQPQTMRQHHIRLTGNRIDVVEMKREDMVRHRRAAGTIQDAALSQGITVLSRINGLTAVATGRSWFTDESSMVKGSKLKPDESTRFQERAINKWNRSNLTEIPPRAALPRPSPALRPSECATSVPDRLPARRAARRFGGRRTLMSHRVGAGQKRSPKWAGTSLRQPFALV